LDSTIAALSLHIVFLLFWAASLLYMPALFLRQALATDDDTRQRAMLMQRWLYARLMTPAALLAVAMGTWLVFERDLAGGWMHVKLGLVLAMAAFHVYCGQLMVRLKREPDAHAPAYYGAMPLLPGALIVGVLWLVTGKPF
jgi:protoporphyrinogen IX oxidase